MAPGSRIPAPTLPAPLPSINAPGCEQCVPAQVIDLTLQSRLVFPESRASLQEGEHQHYRLRRRPPPIERQEVDTPANSPVRFGVFERSRWRFCGRRSLPSAGRRWNGRPRPLTVLGPSPIAVVRNWASGHSRRRFLPGTGLPHFGSFNSRSIARSIAWKRGSLRSGSSSGSLLTNTSPGLRRRTAVSSHSSAWAGLPHCA